MIYSDMTHPVRFFRRLTVACFLTVLVLSFSSVSSLMTVQLPPEPTKKDSGISVNDPVSRVDSRARLDINTVRATVPDTFWHLPCTIGGPGKDIAYQSRHTHPAFVYLPGPSPWRSDTTTDKVPGILFTTPYITSEKGENPWEYIVPDIADPSSATRIFGISGDDTTWCPGPLCRPSDFRQDSIFWFHGVGDTTYYDTGHVALADSVSLNKPARHLSDVTAVYLPGFPPRILVGVRVTWELSNVEMSAIYFSITDNLTDWSDWVQATHMGRWLSPAVMIDARDSTRGYIMFCPLESADRVTGITDTTAIHRFSAPRWDTLWTYQGPAAIANRRKAFRPWHLSVMLYSHAQLLAIIKPTIGHLRLAESEDYGHSWRCSDSVLLKIPPGSNWWGALYQTSGFLFERGENRTLGLVFSGFRDSSAAQIWHIGYAEIAIPAR